MQRLQTSNTAELSQPGHAPASEQARAADDGLPAALAMLRSWRQTNPAAERCELCGAEIAAEHDHLLEPAERRVLCACQACGILFDGRNLKFRRIPRRIERLYRFRCDDAQWESLNLPIDLAFFFTDSRSGTLTALYPSPAGAVEAAPSEAVWRDLIEANPSLSAMEPDIEALLVNHVGAANDWYRAPIDECFKLVGVIRGHWRGLSGGARVWGEIDRFFQELNTRCR